MDSKKQPTRANGKICYLGIPAIDLQRSAEFYKNVFNWTIRTDNDGNVSFDDPTGEVSGMWVLGQKPAVEQGVLVSIMVDSIAATTKAIVAHGGMLLNTADIDATQRTALFSDIAGNVFCLYQSNSMH